MLLVRYEANYADEFDIYGFKFMSEEGWDELKETIEKLFKYTKTFEYYFGTNEYIEYEDSEAILDDLKAEQIDPALAESMQWALSMPSDEYGFFPSNLEGCIEDYLLDGLLDGLTENEYNNWKTLSKEVRSGYYELSLSDKEQFINRSY